MKPINWGSHKKNKKCEKKSENYLTNLQDYMKVLIYATT